MSLASPLSLAYQTQGDLLILGDPLVETLTTADLDAIERFVDSAGGTVLANVHSQGKGALALVNRLLGQQNSFSTSTGDCKAATPMRLAQTSFISSADRKVPRRHAYPLYTYAPQVTEFMNLCHTGLSCSGGISLAKDTSLTPETAQTTLCYGEVGVGRVRHISMGF